MRALVIYESMLGNTKTVAEAIADGIAQHLEVTTADVGAAPTALPDDVGLLVARNPTHAFGMRRPSTRQSAFSRLVLRPRPCRPDCVSGCHS